MLNRSHVARAILLVLALGGSLAACGEKSENNRPVRIGTTAESGAGSAGLVENSIVQDAVQRAMACCCIYLL